MGRGCFSVLKEKGKSTTNITFLDSFFTESERPTYNLQLRDVFGALLIFTVQKAKADWKNIQQCREQSLWRSDICEWISILCQTGMWLRHSTSGRGGNPQPLRNAGLAGHRDIRYWHQPRTQIIVSVGVRVLAFHNCVNSRDQLGHRAQSPTTSKNIWFRKSIELVLWRWNTLLETLKAVGQTLTAIWQVFCVFLLLKFSKGLLLFWIDPNIDRGY